MKLKKALLLLLCFVLVIALTIAGTLAYLTDRDGKANVFTVGDVSISLNEDFEQGATLIPGENIEKVPTITNNGDNDAWVWLTFSIPADLDVWSPATDEGSNLNVIHWNPLGATAEGYVNDTRVANAIAQGYLPEGTTAADIIANNTTWDVYNTLVDGGNCYRETIAGVDYNTYVLPYNKALAAGETTLPSIYKVFLDAQVDIDPDGNWYRVVDGETTAINWNTNTDGAPIIYAKAYAIQAEGFDSVDDAYAAYGKQWGNNGSYTAKVEVNGTDKAALVSAIDAANPGDIVVLSKDTTIAGYAATEKLIIDKAITLDLNGKTLTTESGWGGIDAKGGCSIINGTINHTGNTAAIKAFQVESIENVTINVTETAGKTKGGIVVQEGAGCYIGSIKNVTITGATNGIETYRCGNRTDLAIGSMKNVTIDATDTGILLSAPVGTAKNCNIEGNNIGINMYLYGPYSVSIDLVNCTVSGNTGIYAHDEVNLTNPGTLTLTYDADTVINGDITQEFEAEVADRVSVQ